VYEFSSLAADYAAKDRPLLAALAYGCAKFPCLADNARGTALAKQIESYLVDQPKHFHRF